VLALHDLEVLERDGARDGMPAERDPVRVHRRLVGKRVVDRVGDEDGADRGVRRREALGAGDQVGANVVLAAPEPVAKPAEAGDHLVGAEQDPVAVADRAHTLEVARGRRERAAGVLHRLEDDHGDGLGTGLHDRLVEIVEEHRRELLLGLAGRPVVAIRVAHVDDVRDERLERGAQRRDAVDRKRAERRAVVGGTTGDSLPAALAARRVVLPRELPGRLDCLRPTGDEERAIDVVRRKACKLGRELDRARMRVRPVGVKGQLAHLGERRLADLLAV
jgi:hypothetical protein